MCIIATGNWKHIPTLEDLTKMEEANPHGGGYAIAPKGGAARWHKGKSITSSAVFDALGKLRRGDSWLIHFRIATVGGASDALCHPFPVRQSADTGRHGQAGVVLAHNGHWAAWQAAVDLVSASKSVRKPSGLWSDSRALAWIVSHGGYPVIEQSGGNIVLLSGSGSKRYGKGWTQHGGYWVSNTHWQWSSWTYDQTLGDVDSYDPRINADYWRMIDAQKIRQAEAKRDTLDDRLPSWYRDNKTGEWLKRELTQPLIGFTNKVTTT